MYKAQYKLSSSCFLFVLPAALLVSFVIAYPIVYAVYLSFTNKVIGRVSFSFVGAENYIAWIYREDFWRTFKNTFLIAGATLLLGICFGLPLALALQRFEKLKNIIGAIILIPWIVPTVISILVWAWMFNPNVGLISWVLQRLRIITSPIPWLSVPSLALVAIIIVSAWRRIPYFGVSLNAALAEVPQELYEAAAIDGANALQQFVYITLPAIKGILFLVSVLTFIETSYDFALVYILTRGGPAGATEVISVKTFIVAFNAGQLARGITIPILAFPIFAPAIWLITRRMLAKWASGGLA
ncbi:MAG: sugar ABC transporter permease [Candidatus Bathyarchaeia archaeon]